MDLPAQWDPCLRATHMGYCRLFTGNTFPPPELPAGWFSPCSYHSAGFVLTQIQIKPKVFSHHSLVQLFDPPYHRDAQYVLTRPIAHPALLHLPTQKVYKCPCRDEVVIDLQWISKKSHTSSKINSSENMKNKIMESNKTCLATSLFTQVSAYKEGNVLYPCCHQTEGRSICKHKFQNCTFVSQKR